MTYDWALLILRLLIGLVVAAHGAQKLFGWAGGSGLQGFGGWLATMGLLPPLFWALLGALGEFGGGVLLALGLLNPLGALGVAGAMAMAMALVHWKNGFWTTKGGYEFPFVLLVTSATLGAVGPGRYALDTVLGLSLPAWLFWVGLVGVILITGYSLSLADRQSAVANKPPHA